MVLVQLSSALASDNTDMPAHELTVEAAWLTHTDLSAYQRPGHSNGGDALFRKIGTAPDEDPPFKQDVPPQGRS
ncbi:hypothetical protein [Nocardia salmonicida]|uniref:hypothetical protein n=1 Tax=Nocardia salmonicida TaxID=53431 RepID=UPI0037BE0A9B